MLGLNFVQVKRCSTCGHLFPRDYQKCPYCRNDANLWSKDQCDQKYPSVPEPPFKKRPMSPQAKKRLRLGLIVGASIVVLLIVGLVVWGKISESMILRQSILHPLTERQLVSIRKNDPQFIQYEDLFREIQNEVIGTSEEATYQHVTYQQMLNYIHFVSSKIETAKLREKASQQYEEYRKPYEEQFQKEVEKWMAFYNQHDPSSYLSLTFHTRYEQGQGYDNTTYYPGFWVDIEYPKGAIKDCEVSFGLWREEYEGGNSAILNTASLEQLKEFKQSAGYHFRYPSSDSPDIYNRFSIKYEVKSVTLPDGTLLKLSDLNEIPNAMRGYIKEQTQENKIMVIRELVYGDFQDQEEFIRTYLDKSFKEKDKLCYELLLLADESGVNTFNFIEDEDE